MAVSSAVLRKDISGICCGIYHMFTYAALRQQLAMVAPLPKCLCVEKRRVSAAAHASVYIRQPLGQVAVHHIEL